MLEPGEWLILSVDVVSMFLLAGLLDHGLHHHRSLLITFNFAPVGELLHRLHHFQFLVAHGVRSKTARAGVGAGAGAGAGTTRRRLWSRPTWAIVIPVFLRVVCTWGGTFRAWVWARVWRHWVFRMRLRLGFSILILTFASIVLTSSTLIILLWPSRIRRSGTEGPWAYYGLRRWRRRCDVSIRLIGRRHSISDCDKDVAAWWRGSVEAGIWVAAVACDKNITTLGVEVSNWLRLLVLPHSVSDDVTQGVEGFADLSSIWDILWRHCRENRSLLFSPSVLLLHFLR